MGGPLSAILAEIHMVRTENELVKQMNPPFYKWFVDEKYRRRNKFHIKLKKKACSGQKRNNFVLILKLIFNVLTLKFWFCEINFYLVVPPQIF